MFETLDRMMLAGIGALSMTRKRAEEIFDDYVRRGKEVTSSRQSFVQNLVDSAEQTRRELQDLVDRQIQDAVKRMNLPTRDDVVRIENKLDQLLLRYQRETSLP